jgi:hypothetical protein
VAKAKRRRVSFLRRVPGTRRKIRITFMTSGKKRRRKPKDAIARVRLTDCLPVPGVKKVRCTVEPVTGRGRKTAIRAIARAKRA